MYFNTHIYRSCSISGGSGFLGQHLVRLIEERDAVVKEIRIVDLKPYENRLSKQFRKNKHSLKSYLY